MHALEYTTLVIFTKPSNCATFYVSFHDMYLSSIRYKSMQKKLGVIFGSVQSKPFISSWSVIWFVTCHVVCGTNSAAMRKSTESCKKRLTNMLRVLVKKVEVLIAFAYHHFKACQQTNAPYSFSWKQFLKLSNAWDQYLDGVCQCGGIVVHYMVSSTFVWSWNWQQEHRSWCHWKS